MKHHFDGILRRIYKPSGQEFFIKSSYPYLSSNTDLLNSFSFFSKMMSRKIVPIHTFVNIPALIRKRSMFLSGRAGILTKVWIGDILRRLIQESKTNEQKQLAFEANCYSPFHQYFTTLYLAWLRETQLYRRKFSIPQLRTGEPISSFLK